MVILFHNPGGISRRNAIVGYRLCYHASGGYYCMFTDSYACRNDYVGSYPAVCSDFNIFCAAFLILNRDIRVFITMIEPGNDHMLSKDHIISYFNRPDNHITHSYKAPVPYDDISHPVVDHREIFYNSALPQDKVVKGQDIDSGRRADD